MLKKGVKLGNLSEGEKNRFIVGGTVESLRKKVRDISIQESGRMECCKWIKNEGAPGDPWALFIVYYSRLKMTFRTDA